jgi:hypothetical protein
MREHFVGNLSCNFPVGFGFAIHFLMGRSGGNNVDWSVAVTGPLLELGRNELTARVDMNFSDVVNGKVTRWSVEGELFNGGDAVGSRDVLHVHCTRIVPAVVVWTLEPSAVVTAL